MQTQKHNIKNMLSYDIFLENIDIYGIPTEVYILKAYMSFSLLMNQALQVFYNISFEIGKFL